LGWFDQCADDRHTLPLAAGELSGPVRGPRAEADLFQQPFRALDRSVCGGRGLCSRASGPGRFPGRCIAAGDDAIEK